MRKQYGLIFLLVLLACLSTQASEKPHHEKPDGLEEQPAAKKPRIAPETQPQAESSAASGFEDPSAKHQSIYQAIKANDIEAVRFFLARFDSDINSFANIEIGNNEILQLTPLMYAVHQKNSAIVALCIENVAVVDLKNSAGLTALDIAAKHNLADIKHILENALNGQKRAALPTESDQVSLEDQIKRSCSSSAKNKDVLTSPNGKYAVVSAINTPINFVQKYGSIYQAIAAKDNDAVCIFLKRPELDINKLESISFGNGNFQLTPLMFAVVKKNIYVVKLLVDHGALVHVANPHGDTALKIAERMELQDIQVMLRVAARAQQYKSIGTEKKPEERKPKLLDAVTRVSVLQQIILGYLDTWEYSKEPALKLDHAITAVACAPDNKELMAVGNNGTILIYDNEQCRELEPPILRYIDQLLFSPCGKFLISKSHNIAYQWDLSSKKKMGKRVPFVKFDSKYGFPPNSIAHSPCGQYIALFDWKRIPSLKIWDARLRKPCKELDGKMSISILIYSPCGRFLASGLRNGNIEIFDVMAENEVCIAMLKKHEKPVLSLAFSPDSKNIVSGSQDHSLKIWDIVSGACTHTLAGHIDRVTSCLYTPCGKYIFSGSWDWKIRLWDAATGYCIVILERHVDKVNGLAYCPTGNYVASVADDGILRKWVVNESHLIEWADKMAAQEQNAGEKK